jgi:hypothetical protein
MQSAARLPISFGTWASLDADPTLAELVTDPSYKAKPERILVLRLETFD